MNYLNQWEPEDAKSGMIKVPAAQSVDCGPVIS